MQSNRYQILSDQKSPNHGEPLLELNLFHIHQLT